MDLLSDPASHISVSAISGLEIAVKVRIGKLPEMAGHIAQFDAAVLADGFHHLPLDHAAAVAGGLMPGLHRDPFDRVLAAQAMTDGMTIVTRDPQFAAFGCKVLW
jgi:PIN domain nuclease of toxin-antitoxin system